MYRDFWELLVRNSFIWYLSRMYASWMINQDKFQYSNLLKIKGKSNRDGVWVKEWHWNVLIFSDCDRTSVSPGPDHCLPPRDLPLCAGRWGVSGEGHDHRQAGRPPVWVHCLPDQPHLHGIFHWVQDGSVQGRLSARIHQGRLKSKCQGQIWYQSIQYRSDPI